MAQVAQIEALINAAQKVIGWDVIVKVERVKQSLLPTEPVGSRSHVPATIKSRFCTAAPAAPFPRLSNTAANKTCPVSSFSHTTNRKLSVPLSA
jgi:hypothetical protein